MFCQDDLQVTMLLAPGHNRADRRNMATKLSTDGSHETLWQIIIHGKLVLFFKRSGKVKNKLPVGGRL